MTSICESLSTLKVVALTPPKLTPLAPVKPEPRIVTGAGALSLPPDGLRPVTLGSTPELLMSTYSNVDGGPAALDCPSVSVTITSTGPAPSCDAGAPAGSVSAAGGSVSVRDVAPRTRTAPAGACHAPIWTPATSAVPALWKSVPVTVTLSPPAVDPELGESPVTAGRLACAA